LVSAAERLLDGLNLIPMTPDLLRAAAKMQPALLRSLDAIHLASAMSYMDELTAFVAYDRRLQSAAAGENLAVVVPFPGD
jgi:predicted nucleic acid-binding protein